MRPLSPSRAPSHGPEEGFALIGLVVAIFLILLALSVAAPTVARALRRDQEVEAIHRAEQYTRAIRIFYKKTGRYPATLDELEKTNNIRFLRRRYNDPFTGKPDWRLIKVGENKTTVKGLFGQPLAGIASTGLGSVAGIASTGLGSVAGMASGIGGSSTTNASGTAPTSFGSSSTSSTGSSTNPTGSSSSPGNSGFGSLSSQSATGFAGSGAPFLGVGLPKAGDSITVVNEQTTYPTWEFLYDPRIEQLRSRVTLFGGSMGSNSATTFGSGSTPGSTSSSPFSPSTPSNSNAPSSGSNGFGSGSSFGSGASTPSNTGQTPSNPAQTPQ